MCGLVGFVTKAANGFDKPQVEAFDQLLYVDALRGMDSTGIFMVERDGTMELAKEATAAHDFRQHAEYKEMLSMAIRKGSALIGHNRAATRGVINDENAHPFVVDDRITLVHNGTLWGNHKDLADTEVDSHAIAHVIHENGDDVQTALQKLSGAYALIWHDHKNKSLNFIRNQQRPLHWIEVDRGWIWASEANMIAFILNRFDFKPKDKIAMLEPGNLVTYKQEHNGWSITNKKIELESPKKTVVYTSSNSGCWPGSEEWEDEDAYAVLHPLQRGPQNLLSAPKPPVMQQQNTSIVGRIKQEYVEQGQYGQHPRILKEEMALAFKSKIDITAIAFSNTFDFVKDNTYHAAKCLDVVPVNGRNEELGHFLFAELLGDSKALMKCYVAPDVNEYDLLDMCLNNEKVLMHVSSRYWRCYHDAGQGRGYAVFNCKSYRKIVETVDTEDGFGGAC